MIHRSRVATALAAGALLFGVAPPSLGRPQQPPRDAPAQESRQQQAAGSIAGRVLAADTGRPLRRARILLTGAQIQGRAGLTDDSGAFQFTGMAEGRYTLSASKTGFITLSYGQRRPLQAGTPLQLSAGQELKGIELRLPRGSVISGHLFDDSGEPMAGTLVRVMSYQYAQGSRQLIPGGGGQTNDRGEYRIWGLNPGEYYLAAIPQNSEGAGRGAPPVPAGRAGFPGGFFGGNTATDPQESGYAPTYYPGAPSVAEARPVSVGLGAEVSEVNFSVLLVRTSNVRGRVTSADGSPTSNGNVQLTVEGDGLPARGGPFGNFGSRLQPDGQFSIANVPPGRYTLRARGEVARAAQYATQPLVLAGGDVNDVVVVLAPAATISGTVRLEASRAGSLPDASQIRLTAPGDDFANIGQVSNARVDRDGAFTLDGVPAGGHFIRSAQTPRGWVLKSVVIDGRESIDTPVELRSGQRLTGVSLVFSDMLSEVNGTVTDDRGTPLTELTILAFPKDSDLWRPQARQIMTARPDQNGKFQIRGLPSGDYYVATIDPGEQGEWFDPAFLEQHRNGALALTLGDGDVKTQDFKIAP